MKALFYVAVFANLVFLGWALLIGAPGREAQAPVRAAAIPPIKLAVETSAPTRAGAAPVAGRRCVTVGPFLAAIQVDRAAQLLRADHLSPRQRTAEEAAGTAFVVGLSMPTAADAARTSMRLQSAGVKDVTVAAAADGGGARLSFGSYPTHAQAEARLTALRRFGIDPAITEAARTVSTTWLDVDLGPGDRPVDVAAIQATVGSGASLVLQSCEAPATPGGAATPAPAGPPAAAKAA